MNILSIKDSNVLAVSKPLSNIKYCYKSNIRVGKGNYSYRS